MATKKDTIATLTAATDEYKAVSALAGAGWPGRTAQEALEAARAVISAPTKLASKAADDEFAKAAAKAAGATGLAGHDRDRVAVLYGESKDVAGAASEASPTREGTARALVWYIMVLEAAEAEMAK